MKRVLTVFLTVIFIISSLSIPAFADESIFAEIEDAIVELPEGSLENDVEDEENPEVPAGDVEIEIGDDLDKPESSDGADVPSEEPEVSDESEYFGDDMIELYALEDNYFDAEAFNAKPKVYSQTFENGINTNKAGVDIDFYGNINLSEDISVIKASQAKYGDGKDEVGIDMDDIAEGKQDGSILRWTNHQVEFEAGAKQSVLKFFDVFNKDGLTHADVDDEYAVRFRIFIPCIDGYERSNAQITIGTYSPYLHKADGTYPSATATSYTSDAKQSWTFAIPTGRWFNVYWDGYERDANGNVTGGSPLTPGKLVVNQFGISSNMIFTTMYIDDFEVARMKKLPVYDTIDGVEYPYTVDESDLQPFESANYTLSNASRIADVELGEVVKIKPNGSMKFSNNKYAERFLAEKDAVYKINFKTKTPEILKFEGVNVYIDRSSAPGSDYKVINQNYNLLPTPFGNMISSDEYKEYAVVYKEPGIKGEVKFGGKDADILRAINICNTSSTNDAYIYDVTISKVNEFKPLSPFNSEFDDWGWKYSKNLSAFSFNNDKININPLTEDEQSQYIGSYIPLMKGAEYQLNYKGVSLDGAKFKVQVIDCESGDVIHEFVNDKLNGVEKEFATTFIVDGTYPDDGIQIAYVKLFATDKAASVSDIKLNIITNVIDLDTTDTEIIKVSGNLNEYTVISPKAYLLLDSFDYNTTDANILKDVVDIVIDEDGNYEFTFDNVGDKFINNFRSNVNVLIVGIDGIPYVSKCIVYESPKLKAQLIQSIKDAANASDIVSIISGKSGEDNVENAEILGLAGLDYYTDSLAFIDDVAKVLYANKESVVNSEDISDASLLHNEYLLATALAGANSKVFTDAEIVEYTERIKDRLGIENEEIYKTYYLKDGITTAEKEAFANLIKTYSGNIVSLTAEQYNRVFNQSIFKTELYKQTYHSSTIMNFVNKYRTVLGIEDAEWKLYTDLKGTMYISKADELIARYIWDNNISSNCFEQLGDNLAILISKAKSFVDQQNAANNGPASGGNSGGGGSGGGGGGFVIVPTVNNQINVSTDKYDPKPSTEFNDLSEFNWAKDYIDTLISTGAVAGYEDGTFRPANNITRTEFAKILSVALDVYDQNAKCDYTDIPSDNWGASYIGSLAKLDVVKGKPDGSFGANDHISRQDVAVLVYRLVNKLGVKLPVVNRPVSFADDALISDYAKEAVNALYQAGVISGVGDYRFDPMGYANRAQAAKIIAFFVK